MHLDLVESTGISQSEGRAWIKLLPDSDLLGCPCLQLLV